MKRMLFATLLLASALACADGKGLPDATVPDGLGVNIHFTGDDEKQVALIAVAGFRFVRMDFIWDVVEKKKGEYDFAPYDGLMAALERHHMRALFILDYGNKLYDDGLPPHTDEGRAAFARFARAGAERFKGKGVLWEVWNEPNGAGFWKPKPNAEDYTKLAQATSKALKKGDPDAFVIGPALAGYDYAWLDKAVSAGLLDCVDAISVHAYGSKKPEDAADYFLQVLERRARLKRDTFPQVVSGEWGYPAVGDTSVERQGELIAREMLTCLLNRVHLAIWYDWRDDGADPKNAEHNFGTVAQDLSPKPAYVAMKTLTTELDGFACTGTALQENGDFLLVFTNAKGDARRMAVWTVEKPHKVAIRVDAPRAVVVSLLGERSEVEAKDGLIDLELSGAVKYVEPLPAGGK